MEADKRRGEVCFKDRIKCMLNSGLEWDKRVLTNLSHSRQWFDTLIPLSHESRTTALVARLV